jgi:hypothetical protein
MAGNHEPIVRVRWLRSRAGDYDTDIHCTDMQGVGGAGMPAKKKAAAKKPAAKKAAAAKAAAKTAAKKK